MMILEPRVKKHTAIKYTGENFSSVKRFIGHLYDHSIVELRHAYDNKKEKDLWLMSLYGMSSQKVSPGSYIVNDGYRFSVCTPQQLKQRYKIGD